jgi:hypothetical protein
MGWKDFFQKKTDKTEEPLSDLTLSKLKPGFYVDWDMKTWEVVSAGFYDWGGSEITYEWQLKTADDTVYLEYESDDEEYWSISRKINFGTLDPGIKKHIMEFGDPPDEITYNNHTYYLEETGAGHFFKDSRQTSGQELIAWNYEDEEGEKFLTVEQWGESSFEASTGFTVEEYQFTDILPGKR